MPVEAAEPIEPIESKLPEPVKTEEPGKARVASEEEEQRRLLAEAMAERKGPLILDPKAREAAKREYEQQGPLGPVQRAIVVDSYQPHVGPNPHRFWAKAITFVTAFAGYIASFLGASVVQDKVAGYFNEGTSDFVVRAQQAAEGKSRLGWPLMKASLAELVDPKKWKSTLTFFATMAAGFVLTEWLCCKVFALGLDKAVALPADVTTARDDVLHQGMPVSQASHDGKLAPAPQLSVTK